jgi:hypothetical protein
MFWVQNTVRYRREVMSTSREEAKAKRIKEAAARALAEAEERRKAGKADGERPKEIGGPAGPEPTRYGDWEKGGIASDF